MIGIGQLLIIALVIFVLFGAGKLPSVMGDLGKGLRNFRKNLQGSTEEKGKNKRKRKAKHHHKHNQKKD